MKKAKNSFGHCEYNYRLDSIFLRSIEEFSKADVEVIRLDGEYSKNHNASLIPKMFAASETRTEAGVVALMAASSWLEQSLYSYAVRFLDVESYEDHIGSLRVLSRWLLVPKLCENKDIDDDSEAMNALREMVHARNAVIHPKRQIMSDVGVSRRRVSKESARFLAVCRKLERTVASLRALISS